MDPKNEIKVGGEIAAMWVELDPSEAAKVVGGLLNPAGNVLNLVSPSASVLT